MSSLLAGRLAVVTGAGSGIGRAISQVLSNHGARVSVIDLDMNSAAETLKLLKESDTHCSFACDVASSKSVLETTENMIKSFGTPSILVNCAGITRDATVLKMTQDDWNKVVSVNLNGVFNMTQQFVRASVDNANSPLSVINVSSIVGRTGAFGASNYAATKAGVIGFTKSAAKELARKNIRVNAILPGYTRTPMTEAMPPNVLASICNGIPMGRMGNSEEIANVVLFLASDLSSYVTGITLEVAGGYGM